MSNGRFLILFLITLALLSCGVQMVIDFSSENIASSSLVLASSLLILLYMLWTPALRTHPLSTFAIFGFCATTQLGALVVQTVNWTPLALNLRQPMTTFAMLAMFQTLATIAHATYRVFSHSTADHSESAVRSLLVRAGLYATPTTGTVWVMGFIGLLCQVLGGYGSGISAKVFQGFGFIAWAPFLIPMYVMRLGPAYCNVRRHYSFLAIYIGLIALLAIASNARGMMLSGIMTIALYAVLSTLRSTLPVRAARLGQLAVLAILLGALTIPVSDLVTAMVLARSIRNNASAAKMVEETFFYLQEPQLIAAQQERDRFTSAQSGYDETYFANPLMGRLMETKFHDNALYYAKRLTDKDADRLLDFTGDALWATLPEPMLKAMDIDVDKKSVAYSMGDYISY